MTVAYLTHTCIEPTDLATWMTANSVDVTKIHGIVYAQGKGYTVFYHTG